MPLLRHLQQIEDQTGETPEELILPDFPHELQSVWTKFLDIHRGRRYGISGANPISYADIYMWSRVTGGSVEPWEVQVIMRLDRSWIKEMKSEGESSGSG